MFLSRQGPLGRLGYQIVPRVATTKCSYNTLKAQFITEKSRPYSTSTGKGLEINRLTQNITALRRGLQNLGNAATLHASYSTIPDSYPRNPAAWSRWVVKLLLYWDGMFEMPLIFHACLLSLWCSISPEDSENTKLSEYRSGKGK